MFEDSSVAVVVTAYNEEKLIWNVLESMPKWVDHVVVVNDGSTDRTVEKVNEYMKIDSKVALISHEKNKGVGGAISSGYKYCLEKKYEITVVMNGDAQMDPEDLSALITPLANGEADYAKGNRLFHGKAWELIPRYRYIGNSVLSLLTKIASGYWHIADSQCGYTAISKSALEALPIDNIFPRYGVPNDILVKLNIESMVVIDVPIRPIYNIGEVSGIRLINVIPDISCLLVRKFFERLTQKYVIRDFHPLIFFYILGLIALPLGSGMGFYYFFYRILIGHVTPVTALFAAFLTLTGLLFLLFAMLFDMEYNKHLKG